MRFWANNGHYFLLILVKTSGVVTKQRQEIVGDAGHSTTLKLTVSRRSYECLTSTCTVVRMNTQRVNYLRWAFLLRKKVGLYFELIYSLGPKILVNMDTKCCTALSTGADKGWPI